MPVTIETIDGHQVQITTDDQGVLLSQVNVDPLPDFPVTLTKFAFRSLLTLAEKMVLDGFETSATLTTDQKDMLRTFQVDFNLAEDIDLTDPTLIQGVNALESFGILAANRAAQVLANQKPS